MIYHQIAWKLPYITIVYLVEQELCILIAIFINSMSKVNTCHSLLDLILFFTKYAKF